MGRNLLRGLSVLVFSPVLAHAAPTCEAGFQPRENVCISQCMTDYIACVVTSGGNQQDVYSQIATQLSKDGKIKATASGQGVIVQGGGSLQLGKSDEQQVINTTYAHFYSDSMKTCLEVSRNICNAPPPPPKPVPGPGRNLAHCDGVIDGVLKLITSHDDKWSGAFTSAK
jgi:hypothetical protein